MKILVVDDHKVIRAGMEQLLRTDPDLTGLDQAASGTEAIQMLEASHWDAMVLDISMPGGSGYDVLKWRRASALEVPVVMQSNDVHPIIVKRCLDLGASGFVAKDRLAEELVAAIHAIILGELYLCRVVVAAIGLKRLSGLVQATGRRASLQRLVFQRLREQFQDNYSVSQQVLAHSQSVLERSRRMRAALHADARWWAGIWASD